MIFFFLIGNDIRSQKVRGWRHVTSHVLAETLIDVDYASGTHFHVMYDLVFLFFYPENKFSIFSIYYRNFLNSVFSRAWSRVGIVRKIYTVVCSHIV